jgi:SOS-response transcriptional repressor LexA
LGGADYQRRADDLGEALTQALFATRPLIFIGCGSGLKDPHFSLVLKFLERYQEKTNVKHFILLTREENRAFTANPLSSKISAVPYGGDFKSLLPFLQGLNADDETRVMETPQAGVPDIPSRAGVGFLFYAARAEEELSRARDALQPIRGALREVDDARAIPPGIDRWDLAEQEDKHRQLADGLMHPAARLDDCSQQILPRFRTAAEPAWQAVRLNLSDRPDRLTRIRELAAGLETETSQLLSHIAEGVEDLERRITEYDPSYQDAGDRLSHAHTAFKRARVEIKNLRAALDRYAMPVAGSPYAASPSDPAPRPASSAPPPPDPAARADDGSGGRSLLRVAPILGEIRGGLPSGTGASRPEKIPVPPGYSDRDEIFALRVNGYSMEKDGIVAGDYVTVLRTEDCRDGDLVAAVFGAEADEAAVVKWLRRPEGGQAYLESSEPDGTAQLREHGEFRVAGKVIGVVRWQIKRLSQPPPAVDDEHTD